MIYTSESYSPHSFVRKVGVKVMIMPSGSQLSDPDSSAELVIGTQDIISMTINEGADINAESFKSRSMVLNIINASRLSIANDLTGREIRMAAVINGEEVSLGKFYIDRIIFVDCGLTVRIIASDIVTRLSRFMTGINMSNCAMLTEVLSSGTGATDGLKFEADATAAFVLVYPDMMTEIDSAKDCLQRLAQAAHAASIWVDRQMNVKIGCLAQYDILRGEIPADSIIKRKSEVINRRTDMVLVYGKNKYGNMSKTAGHYVNDYIMASIHNDFMYPAELDFIAENRLRAANYRHRLTLLTRCNPAIEIGDYLRLQSTDASTPEEFVVIGQKIVFDKDGLTSEMELAGYKE